MNYGDLVEYEGGYYTLVAKALGNLLGLYTDNGVIYVFEEDCTLIKTAEQVAHDFVASLLKVNR